MQRLHEAVSKAADLAEEIPAAASHASSKGAGKDVPSLLQMMLHTSTPRKRVQNMVLFLELNDVLTLERLTPLAQLALAGEMPTLDHRRALPIVETVMDFLDLALQDHFMDTVVGVVNQEASALSRTNLPSSDDFRRAVLHRLASLDAGHDAHGQNVANEDE